MVFTKNNGLYVGTDIIKYPFKIIHNELGIKNCRFYDLRGSYATKILRNGAEIRDVADILGHSRIETTENYYISSSEKTRKEANDMLEEIMKSDVINDIINCNLRWWICYLQCNKVNVKTGNICNLLENMIK